MPDAQACSLICPRNDLESQTILDLAAALGLHVIEASGDWGVKLSRVLPGIDLGALRHHVIIVELPGAAEVAQLRGRGHSVHVIDHHQYGGAANSADAASPPSSLEQFAALFDHPLSRQQWLIAINDRDFLPGLAAAGAGLREACGIRAEERAVRDTQRLWEEAVAHVREHALDLDDLRLLSAPAHLAPVMLEAAQSPSGYDYARAVRKRTALTLKSVLVAYYRDGDCTPAGIEQVEAAADAGQRDGFEQLLADSELAGGFEMWSGGGGSGSFFGARRRPEHPVPPIDGLLNRLLEQLLVSGRPLAGYRCSFLLPLNLSKLRPLAAMSSHVERVRLPPDIRGIRNFTADEHANQAWLYFLPIIREFAFEVDDPPRDSDSLKPIEHWRLPDASTAGVEVHLGTPLATDSDPVEDVIARLSGLSLFRFRNAIDFDPDLAVLQIDLEMPPGATDQDLGGGSGPWWQALLFNDAGTRRDLQRRQAETWLRFTKLTRELYGSFVKQRAEGKIDELGVYLRGPRGPVRYAPRLPTGCTSTLVATLLPWMFPRNDEIDAELSSALDRVGDNRLFVNVAYTLAGEPPCSDSGRQQVERLFSYALYVDRAEDGSRANQGYYYDRDFTLDLMDGHRSRRWEALGTYAGFSPYSNTHLGFGAFFRDEIAPIHVQLIYGRMLLLALFYQAALRHFRRRVAAATGELVAAERPGTEATDRYRELRRDFIEFTNRYWFREVTPQIQGIEIFDRQTAALRLQPQYDLVMDQMNRADEYIQATRAKAQSVRGEKIGYVGFLFGIAAVLFTVIGGDGINAIGFDKSTAFGLSTLVAALFIVLAVLSIFSRAFRGWLDAWLHRSTQSGAARPAQRSVQEQRE